MKKPVTSVDQLSILTHPHFAVFNGIVRYTLGGFEGDLPPGQTHHYRRHGKFRVEYAGEDYALIHHESTKGHVRKIFIRPRARLIISNGLAKLYLVYDQKSYEFFRFGVRRSRVMPT